MLWPLLCRVGISYSCFCALRFLSGVCAVAVFRVALTQASTAFMILSVLSMAGRVIPGVCGGWSEAIGRQDQPQRIDTHTHTHKGTLYRLRMKQTRTNARTHAHTRHNLTHPTTRMCTCPRPSRAPCRSWCKRPRRSDQGSTSCVRMRMPSTTRVSMRAGTCQSMRGYKPCTNSILYT